PNGMAVSSRPVSSFSLVLTFFNDLSAGLTFGYGFPVLKRRTDNSFHGTLTRWIYHRSRRTVCPLLLLERLARLPKAQQRAVMQMLDGVLARAGTRPEPDLVRLYDALGLAHPPGGVQKLIS
ncbi:MAG: hypothetical protein WCF44_07045, partial [Candidatus Methylophosphatis roskildensis]